MDKLGQEWVSAAVDGEADEQSIAQLAAAQETHSKWQNYHMIGDAMRGELPQTIALDLSQSIADAIDKEPTIIAPVISDTDSSNMNSDNVAPASKSNVVPFFKQLGQYAIAASVALVAVVGVQNYNQPSELESSPLPVLSTRPLIGSAAPVSFQTGQVQSANQNYNQEQLQEQRRRINAYIQDHMLQQKLNTVALEKSSDVEKNKDAMADK